MIILSGIAARIALKLMSRFALGPKLANVIGHAIVAAVMAGLIYLAYCWAWDRGRDHERAAWQQKVAEIRKERDDAMAALGEQDADNAGAIETNITDNRKALDDETANLPDQPLSDRQRARACRELVRQGRRCEPSAATPGKAGG